MEFGGGWVIDLIEDFFGSVDWGHLRLGSRARGSSEETPEAALATASGRSHDRRFEETLRDDQSTPVHDPRLLERAGWTNAEVIWEQIQEAAAECERADDYAEAALIGQARICGSRGLTPAATRPPSANPTYSVKWSWPEP